MAQLESSRYISTESINPNTLIRLVIGLVSLFRIGIFSYRIVSRPKQDEYNNNAYEFFLNMPTFLVVVFSTIYLWFIIDKIIEASNS